ncbi:MAG: HAMP domain-containing histidine kinase [Bifidobacteriaceae bacterium]|nr:HAMP domain-containing histidine kinase [Bifidobacteriaceae bacterium]
MAENFSKRAPGWSVRLKLTLSYTGFLLLAGGLLLAVVWLFLLRYVPPDALATQISGFRPGRNDLIRAFAPKATWALVFLLLTGLLGGWILAGRMLAPINRMTKVARLVADGSFWHRINLPGAQNEFCELADSFDSMLERLETHIATQQRFAANASHELRTPLAVTKTLLDVARRDPNRNIDDVLARLSTINDRAIAQTEALLLLNQADQGSFDSTNVDLSLLVEEAVETLLPLAEKQGITIETDCAVTTTCGSPDLLRQLVINLLHNAIIHNQPTNGVVTITTSNTQAMATLSIENSGDLLNPQTLATLTEPYKRGTDRIHHDQAGFGLGLAIVTSIARAHKAGLSLTPRPTGGLLVKVQMPSS